MTLTEPKPSPRPWFALWRREAGTFAQLPLLARAIFSEVLKLTDDDGEIDIGTRQPADAIAWALGADRADRRALAKYVPMLLADGCLVHDGERLIAPSFRRWQPTAKRPRANAEPTTNGHDAVANVPRTDHEPTTIAPRTDHETEAKSAEPFSSGPHSRVEESREKDILPGTGAMAGREALLERARSALTTGYAKRYEAAPGTDVWQSADANRREIMAVAAWVVAKPANIDARVADVLDGVFANDWMRAERWPWKAIAKDPGKYAASARKVRPEPPSPQAAELARLDRAIDLAEQRGDRDEVDRLRAELRAFVARPRRVA